MEHFYACNNTTFSVLLKRLMMAALRSELRYPKMSFSLRNFCIDCAINSLPVYKYVGIRPSLFNNTREKTFIAQLFILSHNDSIQTYLLSIYQ